MARTSADAAWATNAATIAAPVGGVAPEGWSDRKAEAAQASPTAIAGMRTGRLLGGPSATMR